MDQGLKILPLLAVLLITWRCSFGYPGGVYSKTNLQWGQTSHSGFVPRAVQSSQSEYPVTGSISVEKVGSSLIIDRSQKSTSRFSNPRRYVKGGFSSSHETSRTQTGSVSAALAVPQDERQTSSLTSLQPQVSSSSSVQNIASQLASGQSLQNQYSSSSHGGYGLQSAGGLSQIVSHQREGSSSGLLSSPGVSSQHTPESNVKLSSLPLMVSSHATTAQSSPILNMLSTLESSGPLLGVSGSASSSYGAPGASTEYVSSPSEIYHQPSGDNGSLSIHASGSESSLPLQSSGAAVHVYSSESLSSSPSIETQGSTFTSQGSPITAQVISSGPVIVTTREVSSGSIGSPSQSISSQYSPGTLTPSKLGSLSLWLSNQSTSDQSQYMSGAPSRSAMPLASSSHYVPPQTGSSSRDLSSPKPQGTYAVYAPSSPSNNLNVAASSPQSVSFQSGSDQDFRWTVAQVGTQAGESSQFMSSQGGSSSYSGTLSHPQSSPSKYSSGALKPTSPQTVSRPLTSVASSHGSSGGPFGASSQSASQGSGFGGSMQSLGTSSQNVPSSPTFSKLSSSRLVSSPSKSDPGVYGTVPSTSQIGSWPQSGVSIQFVPSQGASSSYSGSFPQSQSSSPKYSLGHTKPNSPQTVSRQSASVKGSQGSSVDPLGAFSQLASHGMSSSFSGSAQPQGTFSQPAPSSPTVSKFSSSRQAFSQSTSDQDLYGQLSATSQFGSQPQKGTSPQLSQAASGFNSGSLPQSQGSLGQYAPASHGLDLQGMSSSLSGSSQGTFSKPAPSSPTVSKFSSSRQVFSQSTSDQDLYGQLSATSQFGSQPQKGTSPQLLQAASGFNSGSLPQSQGSLGQYAPASHGLASHGMSSSFSGSAQPQGTFSQPAPSSPTVSKFSSSRQVFSQSTSDQDLYGQLSATSQFGSRPQKGTLPQLSQAASGSTSGSFPQSQGSLGQCAPESHVKDSQGMSSSFIGSAQGTYSQPAPSSSANSKFSSSRQLYSQSTSDPDLYGQLSATSQFGSQPQKGTYPQLSQAASGFTSGSFPQYQGSLGQYAPASPSKYVNAPLASQGFATQSATESSRRGLTSTFLGGSQSGSSLTLQGTGSSSMPQGTMSQFVSGSPSQHSSTSLSSTQSVAGQYSPASWMFSVSQRPQRQEPSVSSWTQGLQSSGAALSQGNLQSPSSQVHSRFSSPLSAGDSANQSNPQAISVGSGQLVSSPGGSGSYSGIAVQSPSTSSRYPLGSPGYVKLGSSLDSSQSATGQSSSPYGSTLQTGSGAQNSFSSYASLQGGSSAVVGPSSQYGSVFSPLDAKATLYLSRPSAASLTQGIQTSKTSSSRSTSSAQMSSGFSSSLSALSQNVALSGPMSAVWRSQSPLGGVQSPSRLSSSFQAPSTIGGQMSERFTSHHAADSSLPPSSGLSAQLSSTGMFSGSSLPKTAQTL